MRDWSKHVTWPHIPQPKLGNVWDCYIARLSLNKIGSVIDSNVSRPGYNCADCLIVFAINLKIWSLGKPVSFVSPRAWCLTRLRLGKHQDSRENKTNCFPRDHALSVFNKWIYKQWSPFGAKICSDICPRTSSVESFPRAKLEENCELRGTDNVQGQISEHIFSPNGDYCLYISTPNRGCLNYLLG